MITGLLNESNDVDKNPRHILITAPQGYESVVEALQYVVRFADSEHHDSRAQRQWTAFSAPNRKFWSNAPEPPPTPNENGLVLHGRDVFNDALATAFSRCFQIKRDLDPLPPEVAARLAKFNGFAENDIILWIAVGTEGPWKEGTVGCS